MYRSNKRNIRGRRGGKQSLRDRIRDKVTRIAKKYEYVVEKSKYPEEEKKWIVFYKCETEHGCNYQRVFKGTLKDCRELANELNKEVKKSE